MIVTLSNKQEMFKTILPDKITGQYWIKDVYDGKKRNLICVEAVDGVWIAKSNRKARFMDSSGEVVKTVEITNGSVYILNTSDGEKTLLYASNYASSGKTFKKLDVPNGYEIKIGRTEDNTICYVNKFISSHHVILKRMNDAWSVQDLNSTNGTYVNNKRITLKTLVPGDVVTVMGLRIIIGKTFIAMNNPNHEIVYDEDILEEYIVDKSLRDTVDDEDEIEENFFYRSPRLRRKIEPLEYKVSQPSPPQDVQKVPMALLLGPSITMGMGSASTAAFSVVNAVSKNAPITNVLPTLIMAIAMLSGMILWPIITKKYERKNQVKLEAKRQKKYRQYLMEVRDRIVKESVTQAEILNENNISLTDCENVIMIPERRLWERSIGQDDFLELRVGIGDIPLVADISFPERGFTINEDNLQDDLQALAAEPKILRKVPITFSLINNNICGIIGSDYEEVCRFVKGLIIRIAAFHSYDEVKLVFLGTEDAENKWEFIKWLPHTWDNSKKIRFFAVNENDTKEIFSYIDRQLETLSSENHPKITQHYVLINICNESTKNSETMRRLYEEGDKYGYSIINIADEIRNLPKECSNIIEINGNNSKIYDKNDISGICQIFEADTTLVHDENLISRKLSNIRLDLSSEASELPNMITFLEMFGVGKIEHLNSLTRWKENNPTVTLKAPIGVDSLGHLFYLDLHEKFQGPHGLVAGMTGSGKSEFIITYILSLAVNYHPDEVAFILIDYKGGGLAGAFEDKEKGIKLPHLAGTITNLDGASVNRSLISIQSELRKRQAAFNEARKVSGEGTIDIYKYQKLYRDGMVKEPIPHLFIISDEFAELKSQQPEFMAQLISAARIGRSLGVHLILATQKPSGVVDDQIWSNSRFRVCLKVQEKSDSMDMIKRPDAAELAQTGRFYLQVGFNEFFDIGQSAWCGASYVPQETNEKVVDNSIQIIDNMGRISKDIKGVSKSNLPKSTMKQIVGVVKYLSDLATDGNISVKKLWLDEIPEMILLNDIKEKYNYRKELPYVLESVLGEYDDPFNQSQELLTLPITKGGNTVIYGNAVSGKELFLNTVIYDLCNNYSPDYLNIYILDFGSEALGIYKNAPHVGDVVFSNEEDKLIQLVKMLKSTLMDRKKVLSDYNGSFDLYYKENTKPLSNTLVIVDNFAALNELYEDVVNEFAYFTREGIKYGIYFIFTATTTFEVKYKIAQNCGQVYMLQLNDKSDYSAVIGSTEGVYPSKKYGRGIVKKDHTYEYQIAHVCEDSELQQKVKESCIEWRNRYGSARAPEIPIVPENVEIDNLWSDDVTFEKFPVGYDVKNIRKTFLNVKENIVNNVMANEYSTLLAFASTIREMAVRVKDTEVRILDENSDEQEILDMFSIVLARFKEYKNTQKTDTFSPIVCIIDRYSELSKKLGDVARDKLEVLIEKTEPIYNINYIIIDDIAGVKKFKSIDWYKLHVSDNDGIWIGDGFNDQYYLKGNIALRDIRELKSKCGFVIRKGQAIMTKFPMNEEVDE